MRATLAEIRLAVETTWAYLNVGDATVSEAVDLCCDHQGIPSDADRRIIRNAVMHRLDRVPDSARKRAVRQ